MRKFARKLSKARFRLSLPFISYEVGIDELFRSQSIDHRIAKLGEIKRDLLGAIEAVETLQTEAHERKGEVAQLQESVKRLRDDKDTAETILRMPEESFARLISRASARGRIRGVVEGLIIGFMTGGLSSLLIWYLTKGH